MSAHQLGASGGSAASSGAGRASRPLRILLLNERCPSHPRAGGAELHLSEIFSRLVARGEAEVTLLCAGTPDLPASSDHKGLTIARLGTTLPGFYLGLRKEVRRRVAAGDVDLIVEAHNKVPFLTPLYAGVPVLVIHHHLHGWTAFRQVPPLLAAGALLLEKLIPWVYRRSRFLTISGSSKTDLVRRGLSESQVEIVPCGVNHEVYSAARLAGRAPTIVSFGRLEPYKRVDLLIRAMPSVLAAVPAAKLVILGDGQDRPRLERLASRLRLGRSVEFAGHVEEHEKIRHLRRAALHVQCSSKEGWGLTVSEAAACGVPSIAAHVPGLCDSVQDGVTGLLVRDVTPASLSTAVVGLLTDEPRRLTLAERAVSWSLQFGWASAAEHVLSEIRRVLAVPVAASPVPPAEAKDPTPALPEVSSVSPRRVASARRRSFSMNTYERRRLNRAVCYLLIVLLGLPPGFLPKALATNRRLNTLTRDTLMETFRNPQFSSAASNRFLFTQGPTALVGEGGASFSNPGAAGYGSLAEPEVHWLTYKGRLEWSETDAYLPSVGLPLLFQRIYRGSVEGYDGPLGKQWEFNWNRRLYEEGDSDVVVLDMGRAETYDESGGSYTSPAGRYDTLAKNTHPNPDEMTRTDREGIVETYVDEGGGWFRLKSMADLNSNALAFAYDSNGLLTKVTDSLSRDHTLSYDANDRITKIADSASREWVYGYDGSGYLTSVRTPVVDEAGSEDDYTSGKTTTYLYDGGGLLTEIKRPGDSTGTWKWTYDTGSPKRITKQTKGGNDINITYDETNRYVTVVDREGVTTRYQYSDSDKLITKRNIYFSGMSSSWETTYTYNSAAEVTEAVFSRGNRVAYTYDGSGNVVTVDFKKDVSDSSPARWVYSYASNGRVSTLKDPNGNLWDFDWSAAGNLTRKAAPTLSMPDGIVSEGNQTIVETWGYNSAGLVTTYVDPVGTTTAYEYTTVNSKPAYLQRVIANSGGLNLTTAYAYSSAGNVTSVTDPEGNATTYTVNALNQVILAAEPGSVTRKTHFDEKDRITKTEASNDSTAGNSWFVEDLDYDAVDNLTRRRADLDASVRLTTAYAFDKNDRLTLVTSPEGNETVYGYDQRDLQITHKRKAASSSDDAITVSTYDENGNVVTVTNPLGFATIYVRDGYDRVTKVTKPEGNYHELAYDKNGNVTQQTWKNSANTTLAQTTFYYDEANRLYQTDRLAKKANLSTNLGDGTQTDIVWRDEAGRVLEHSGDVCGCANDEHVYDAVGREVTKKDPMGASDATRNLVLSEYDKNGRVTRVTHKERTQDSGIEADKDTVVEMVYDSRGRMITRKEKLASTPTWGSTVYFYGLRDQLTKVLDPESDELRYEHNEQLWKTKDTAENGSSDVITEYYFDDDGLLLTYRAKNSTTGDQDTTYSYDKLGRVVTTVWPDTEDHIYTYDKASQRISTTDPNGTVIVASYDQNGRLTAKDLTLATNVLGATSVDFGHDGLDRMTLASTSEAGGFDTLIERTYNTLGKIETEKQVLDGYNSGNGRTITYDWDVEGQKTGVTYPVSGAVISYTRDALDRVDKVSRGSSQIVDYTFNGRRVIKKAYAESFGTYLYDYFGRLTEIHHKDTDTGNTLVKTALAYDKSHQITSQDKLFYDDVQNTRITTDTIDKGDQYDYDGAKRLVTVLRGVPTAYIGDSLASNISNNRYDDFVEYVYDQTGNRLTRKIDGSNDTTYAYNTVNEMTTEGSSTGVYYDNGTFKQYSGAGNDVNRYNHADQYAQWDKGPFGAPDYTWHYDALGRQVARVKTGSGGVGDVRMYHDGVHDIEAVSWASSTETQTKRRVYGERIDELLEYTDLSADPDVDYFVHSDHLGSVLLMTDNAGNIDESYRYKEFGETTVVDGSFVKQTDLGSDIGNSFRYTGRERALPASFGDDWYWYRARTYRPEVGRFMQRDPAGYVDGANRYGYVMNSPIPSKDPYGLQAVTAGSTNDCSFSFTPNKPPTTPAEYRACVGACKKAKAGFLEYLLGPNGVCSAFSEAYSSCAAQCIGATFPFWEICLKACVDGTVTGGLGVAPFALDNCHDQIACTSEANCEGICLMAGKTKKKQK
ncbi:MAG: glycosyltransferase [Planctomycetota bacterium]